MRHAIVETGQLLIMMSPGSNLGHFIDVRVDVIDVNDRHLDAVVAVVQRTTQNLTIMKISFLMCLGKMFDDQLS